ncbi:hypothetical protein [Marinagarivorans algicola]|uniref:hypothetical protein n=1 Tax=Marinagarivorans algicola TaxID=1513270 RepID=UPI003734F82B
MQLFRGAEIGHSRIIVWAAQAIYDFMLLDFMLLDFMLLDFMLLDFISCKV